MQPGFHFHHVGIACRDLDADERVFAGLGYVREGTDWFDPIQNVHARFLVGAGPRVELVVDAQPGGPVAELERKGVKLYHMAYEVDDLRSASRGLEALGAKQVTAPTPGIAFGMRLLCFYALPNLALIELIARA
ncbi:MAG TPA: VOC family protein [Candidatus Baltobacteraceae bacterium]|nr:VOC family protein [Candidatus Baltobacteraceae bacterium]